MAEILIFEFPLLEDKGAGFDDGDIIQVYYDDVADSIKTYLAGAGHGPDLFTNGPILRAEFDDHLVSDKNYQFCTGDDLTSFQRLQATNNNDPYVEKVITVDSPSCTGNVCDLIITSVNTTPDTGPSDGSITINATSTGTVRYALSNVNYASMSASNSFTGLISGNYTVWVKDDLGCVASRDVTVQAEENYQDKFILEFDNPNNETQFVIQERGYSGSSELVCLGDGCQLDYPNQSYENLYDFQAMPSQLNVSLHSDTDFKYVSLFTSQHKKIRGILKRGGVEYWRGYLLPSVYSEPYIPPPYNTNFTFVDGIELLENTEFEELNIRGRNQLITIVYNILSNIGLDLPIHVAVNVYAQGMNSSSGMLQQSYLNADTLLEYNAQEALDEILTSFNACLWQHKGAWWIIRQDERYKDFTYYIYEEGVQTGSGTHSPLKNLGCPTSNNRIININRDANLEILPAYGKINLLTEFDIKESLISNYDFEELNPLSSSGFESWTYFLGGTASNVSVVQSREKGNSAAINLSAVDDHEDAYLLSNTTSITYQSGDKIRFSYEFSWDRMDQAYPFLIVEAAIFFDGQYLKNDGTWSGTFNRLRFYPAVSEGGGKVEITAELPDVTGIDSGSLRVFIYPEAAGRTDITDISTLTTADKSPGYKEIERDASLYFYELVDGNGGITGPDYDPVTNDVSWNQVRVLTGATIQNNQWIVDNVEIDYLPQGQKPVEEQKVPFIADKANPEVYDAKLKLGALPLNYVTNTKLTPNDINLYESKYFGLLRTFYSSWGRKGFSEAVPLQILYVNTILEQHATPTFRVYGTFSPTEIGWSDSPGTPVDLAPFDCLYESDNGIYYIVTSITYLERQGWYVIGMTELKAANSAGAFTEHDIQHHDMAEHS